jgi:arginine decarboxylase
MDIMIASGIGQGPTSLAAFDAALREVGVADYNLIYLSSVIPPRSVVTFGKREDAVNDQYGHRLYVVIASESAWAGLGWVQREDGRGLFVEEHGSSKKVVRSNIIATLGAMMQARGGMYSPIQEAIVGTVCHNEPVCAVVVAVYENAAWGDG